MKSVIGVMPLWDEEKESIWMLPGYLDGIKEAGGLPVIFPLIDGEEDIRQLASNCDGFLFTGGHDVSPSIYGEKPLEGKTITCSFRDKMESIVLDVSLKEKKPALGICRGIQLINAYLGGSLYQDLPTEYPSDVEHHMNPPYAGVAHRVEILPQTPLAYCLHMKNLGVNSLHHQAIRTLSSELQPMAVSEDGIIEGVYAPDHPFLWAVQWHPEFSYMSDEASRKIFRSFVSACET